MKGKKYNCEEYYWHVRKRTFHEIAGCFVFFVFGLLHLYASVSEFVEIKPHLPTLLMGVFWIWLSGYLWGYSR
jgi:intracellular septation protein A